MPSHLGSSISSQSTSSPRAGSQALGLWLQGRGRGQTQLPGAVPRRDRSPAGSPAAVGILFPWDQGLLLQQQRAGPPPRAPRAGTEGAGRSAPAAPPSEVTSLQSKTPENCRAGGRPLHGPRPGQTAPLPGSVPCWGARAEGTEGKGVLSGARGPDTLLMSSGSTSHCSQDLRARARTELTARVPAERRRASTRCKNPLALQGEYDWLTPSLRAPGSGPPVPTHTSPRGPPLGPRS